MGADILNVLSGIVAIAVAGLITAFATYIAARLRQQSISGVKTKSYNERISELTASLTQASTEVDRILNEMVDIVKERQSALSALEQQETELQNKIDSLKNVPVEAAEFFTQYLARQEQKSSKRDYWIFALGVITTTIISVIIAVILHFVLK